MGLGTSLLGRQREHSRQDRPPGRQGPGRERDKDGSEEEGAGDGECGEDGAQP